MSENLLGKEASPYLLQHKDNPVHWRAWGPDALAEARRDSKPILLSIGYAACHWCHVMAHESFENPEIAAVMNRLFVNIKVDREERPDIDQIYMAALHALGEQGGWPLTMFLTPDGEPIWGGTYFPPKSRYGRPGFVDVLTEVARLYKDEPEKLDHNKKLLLERLNQKPPGSDLTLNRDLLDNAAQRLLELMDGDSGGVRGAPKFPQASLLELLWRAGRRTGNPAFHESVLLTLRNIASGGIYDHIGGGFSRYSVDSRWLVPHFEKMLYDNAQLVEIMTYAHIATGEPLFLTRIEETITWLEREMIAEGNAFSASLDADSDGHEGRFYVWSHDEILEILGAEEGEFFAAHYDITPTGNWEGTSIPNRLAQQFLPDAETEQRLSDHRDLLLAHRETRIRPSRDDKILADWNGLMISALVTAGTLLDRPDWVEHAVRAYQGINLLMKRDDRLAHSYRAGKSVRPGLATDYAAMIKAALSLHVSIGEQIYLADAERLAEAVRTHHWDDEAGGYFLTADNAADLIIRPRSNTDEATPSANAVMGANLVRLWRLTGKDHYRRDIDTLLDGTAGTIANNLFATSATLNALDARLEATDIVVIRPAGTDTTAMIGAIHRHWTHNSILSIHEDQSGLADDHPAAGKTAIDGKVTVYVCRDENCSLPKTEPNGIAELFS